jgi:hypothetical protein
MDLGHLITSLSHLLSFNHAQCDAILQSRRIEVVNAYNPGKAGWGRDGVYFGFFWIIGWLAMCSAALVFAWRQQDPNAKMRRRVFPFFLLFGLCLLYVQLQTMAQYVDVCRSVLGSASSVSTYHQIDSPWPLLLALAAFAGVWFTGLVHSYRRATNSLARVMPIVMMILGGVFFVFVGGTAIVHLFH